jgi:hypothetical protein
MKASKRNRVLLVFVTLAAFTLLSTGLIMAQSQEAPKPQAPAAAAPAPEAAKPATSAAEAPKAAVPAPEAAKPATPAVTTTEHPKPATPPAATSEHPKPATPTAKAEHPKTTAGMSKLEQAIAQTPKGKGKGQINPDAPKGFMGIPGAPSHFWLWYILWGTWVGWIFSSVGAFGGIMAGVGHISVFGLSDYAGTFM